MGVDKRSIIEYTVYEMQTDRFAAKLRELKTSLGVDTDVALAQELGISKSYVSLLLSGKRTPSLALYLKMEDMQRERDRSGHQCDRDDSHDHLVSVDDSGASEHLRALK